MSRAEDDPVIRALDSIAMKLAGTATEIAASLRASLQRVEHERDTERRRAEHAESVLAITQVARTREQARADRAEAEVTRLTARRFQVMGGPSIPWALVAPYDRHAFDNHGQSLDRLHERGGVDVQELWCIVHGKRLRDRVDKADAQAWFDAWWRDPGSVRP